MSIDPVDQDLNRHLREVDEAEARSEEVEEIVDEIFEGACKHVKLEEIVAKWLESDEDVAKQIAEAIEADTLENIKNDAVFYGLVSDAAAKEHERRIRESEDARGEVLAEREQARLRGEY